MKTVVIIGASSGIGAALATELGRQATRKSSSSLSPRSTRIRRWPLWR
jgi:hypothetical protein